jgi:23S rRNA pseudoU1915 N3-methylase RlmH
LKLIKLVPHTILKQVYSYYNWFKRVILHDKVAILTYKENQLNKRFKQYYKFFDALKNYDIITVNEAHKSRKNIIKKQNQEHKELVKSIYPEESQENINTNVSKK